MNTSEEPKLIVKGIWIPIEIWEHPELSLFQRCLWATISSLSRKSKPCFASNDWLAARMHSTPKNIGNEIAVLKRKGLLQQVSFDGRTRYLLAEITDCTEEADPSKLCRQLPVKTGVSFQKILNPDEASILPESKVESKVEGRNQKPPRKRDGSSPSDHQILIDTWMEAFQIQHGHRYGFAGGKDAAAVKRLLTYEPSVQAIMDVATRAWTTATGFLFDQSLTLAGFASQWNVLANGKGQVAPAPGRAAAPRLEVAKAPAVAKANDDPQVLRGPAAWDAGWAELRYPDVYGRPDPKAPVLRDNMTREEAMERMAWFAESEKIRNARAAVDRAEDNVVAASKKAGAWSGDFKQLYLSDPGVAEAAKELQAARAALKALEPKEAK